MTDLYPKLDEITTAINRLPGITKSISEYTDKIDKEAKIYQKVAAAGFGAVLVEGLLSAGMSAFDVYANMQMVEQIDRRRGGKFWCVREYTDDGTNWSWVFFRKFFWGGEVVVHCFTDLRRPVDKQIPAV